MAGLCAIKLGNKALAIKACEKGLALIETSPDKDKLAETKAALEKTLAEASKL